MTPMRRTRWIVALPLVAVLLSPHPAAAQDPRLERRLDTTTLQAVSGVLDSARLQRVLEGSAKHAAPSQIVAAVRRLALELATARTALGAASSPIELAAAASALRAGIRPSDLTLLRHRRSQSLTVALATLADLVTSGVPPDSAAAAVIALAASARDDQIAEFRRAVERDIALGAPQAAAMAVRVDATVRQAAGAAGIPRRP
jgi:hypothetical protein